ncbi:alpha-N-arabinofuranosidase [Gilvimarinus chinensis]|uniref:alpha-N-arabinofuranosidase n=1 Tax=Gilvimarinus chinensis TaxID=396005 RepID=UPI00035EFD9D|nr:alpha-L-arabinofuranosidase C-terminal domain-containing protein [Gilvimarinus chinensis]
MKLKTAIACGLLLTSQSLLAKDHTVEIEFDASESGPLIHKDIYGQFAEHLGRGIYEGVWVGEDSDIPNTRGFRNDVLNALRDINVPLVRWPGGCFADEYHWREGIGPRDERPVKVNTHWGGVEEPNTFGTHEFFEFVELLGADAYVNGNLGSGSVQEMAEWMEYMTGDKGSTLAEERRKNGREEPFEIAYFGVGNEAWGCGGHMRPEYYSDLYRHYSTFLKAPHGKMPKLVASGGTGDDTSWTDVLSKNVEQKMDGISFHYYTLPLGDWDKKGRAVDFPKDEWAKTMAQTYEMDRFIQMNLAVLEENDPDNTVKLYVDEWGTWYDPEPERDPGFLYQQNTLRDAVVAAVNFNIFHKYADRVTMTNIAQMVNVLQAMILTDKEKMVLTPTYYAYGLYKVFQNSTSIPFEIKAPGYKVGDKSVPAVTASVARGDDGKLYMALVNLDPENGADIKLDIDGVTAKRAVGQMLTAEAMDARNTFEDPDAFKPVAFEADLDELEIPAKSVVVVELK